MTDGCDRGAIASPYVRRAMTDGCDMGPRSISSLGRPSSLRDWACDGEENLPLNAQSNHGKSLSSKWLIRRLGRTESAPLQSSSRFNSRRSSLVGKDPQINGKCDFGTNADLSGSSTAPWVPAKDDLPAVAQTPPRRSNSIARLSSWSRSTPRPRKPDAALPRADDASPLDSVPSATSSIFSPDLQNVKRALPDWPISIAATQSQAKSPRGHEVVMLFGSPVDWEPIDCRAELQMLSDALAKSGIRLKAGNANADSLATFFMRVNAGKELVLYLLAHGVRSEADRFGLGLEEADGMSHVLWREQLEELLSAHELELSKVFLVFLSACWSEEFAQIFIERGCRHVIAIRGKVLDRIAHQFSKCFFARLASGASLLRAFEGARAQLRVDPDGEVVAAAERFVLFGQRSADTQILALQAACGSGDLKDDFEDAATYLSVDVPPATSFFVGRNEYLRAILNSFARHRICVIYGEKGMGKRTLAQEFTRYASAPGRRFSCCTALLETSELGVDALACDMHQQLIHLVEQHALPTLAACETELNTSGRATALAFRAARLLQHLERYRRGAVLLVVNDRLGMVNGCAEIRAFLGEIIERTHRSYILVCSREPAYCLFGARRVANIFLRGLPQRDAARLFLQCVNRRLEPTDFPAGQMPSDRLCDLWNELGKHPLLRQLDGNPRQLCEVAAERVVPNGPNLVDIAISFVGDQLMDSTL